MIDATDLVRSIERGNVDPLVAQAIRSHPSNRSHRAKWVRAVRYLRRRNRWVLDGARVTWGVPGEAA
jgi:hypothetical protein